MPTSMPAFVQSAVIIGREGLEVVLILAAVLAVLGKVNQTRGIGPLWWGAGLAVGASLLTAALVEIVFHSSEHVELLEGLTLALAAGVLLYVGHWLLAKRDVARWKAYLADRVRRGAARGSTLALGLVAFLAVYREGVETVLFYRALLSTEEASAGAVLAGFLVGVAGLGLVCYAIYRFGLRIPLRPFFTTTSALLMLLAFAFAGKAVHELQEAGLMPETGLSIVRIAPLGVYPTLETVAAQVLLLSGIVGPLLLRRTRRVPGQVGGRHPAVEGNGGPGLEREASEPEGVARPATSRAV